jgi:hypothetical protein
MKEVVNKPKLTSYCCFTKPEWLKQSPNDSKSCRMEGRFECEIWKFERRIAILVPMFSLSWNFHWKLFMIQRQAQKNWNLFRIFSIQFRKFSVQKGGWTPEWHPSASTSDGSSSTASSRAIPTVFDQCSSQGHPR